MKTLRSAACVAAASGIWAFHAAGAAPIASPRAAMEALSRAPVQCTSYDGIGNDLLTAGLGKSGLAGPAPAVADPLNPTPAELRRLAIYTNYRALVDVSSGGGYGTLYGPNVAPDGTPTGDEGKIAGVECLAFADDGSARRNVTLMVQIPDAFDPLDACIVTGPSSGSRGIYGAIGTSGEWGLKHGCAVAYTDKGTGTGAHDLHNDTVNLIDGERESADFAGKSANFRAPIGDAERLAFDAATPNRFALKHAHSQQNPEADWDVNVLQATLFAFLEANRLHPDAFIVPANTVVIGSSVSNGGGASLRAAEIDPFGLIDGVAVSEPNVNPPEGEPLAIIQGAGTPYLHGGRPLYDYATLLTVFQGCANLAQPDAPLNSLPTVLAENRCAALHRRGLLVADAPTAQAAEAQAIINGDGILPEQNVVQPAMWTLFVPQAIAVTYANAYARAGVQANLCGYSFAATDAAGNPVALAESAEALLFATSNGIPPTGGIAVIDNNSLGGPRQDTLSISESGLLDQNLDGALCLRSLWLGRNPVTGGPQSDVSGKFHDRLLQGIDAILATADLKGIPAIIVQGRSDGVVQPNHAGRAYYARNRQVEGSRSRLRYVEVTNAQHLDALNGVPGFDTRFIPLHYYFTQAMDLMWRHLKFGEGLPPSQVVHPTPRGGTPGAAPAITASDLPPIRLNPAQANRITFSDDTLRVPD